MTSSLVITHSSPLQGDIHICGSCKSHFTVLQEFISHKIRTCIGLSQNHIIKSDNINFRDAETTDISDQRDELLYKEILRVIRRYHSISHTKADETIRNNDLYFDTGGKSVLVNLNESFNDAVLFNSEVQPLHSQSQETNCQYETVKTFSKSTSTPKNYITTESVKGKEKFMCAHKGCTYSSLSRKDTERHYRIHTGERPFKCPVCNKRFTRSDKLQVHQRIHSGEKPYKCSECSYASVESGSLTKHMRIHKDIRPFWCQLCTYRSRDSSHLTAHLRTHTGDAPFVCTFERCKSAFKTISDLKRHSKIHSKAKPFMCSLCSYRCSFKAALSNHMARQHPNNQDGIKKPHCCPHCSEPPFGTIRKLNNHLKKKHNIPSLTKLENNVKEKKIKKQKFQERKIDAGVIRKDFNCNECSAAFVSPSNLRVHKLQHSKQMKLRSCETEAALDNFCSDPNRDNGSKVAKSHAMLDSIPILTETAVGNESNFYIDSGREKESTKCDKGSSLLDVIGNNVNLSTSSAYLGNGDLDLKTAQMLVSLSDLQLPRTYSSASAYFNSDDELNNGTMELNL